MDRRREIIAQIRNALSAGHFDAAEQLIRPLIALDEIDGYRLGAEVMRASEGPDSLAVAGTLSNLACVLAERRMTAEAADVYAESARIFMSHGSPYAARMFVDAGFASLSAGDCDAACEAFDRARDAPAEDAAQHRLAHVGLGQALNRLDRADDAFAALWHGLRLPRPSDDDVDLEQAQAELWHALGLVSIRLRRPSFGGYCLRAARILYGDTAERAEVDALLTDMLARPGGIGTHDFPGTPSRAQFHIAWLTQSHAFAASVDDGPYLVDDEGYRIGDVIDFHPGRVPPAS